jgi:hypothetical protein
MAHETCAVNGACAEPPRIRGTADTVVDLPTRAFGMLPNTIACAPEVDECALVMLGARLTYAGAWVMTRTWAQGLVRRGLGEHCYWRGLALLVDRGLVKRRRQANGRQGHGEVVDDRVCLPPDAGEHCRRIERAWFSGAFSVKAVAALLFIRAQADGEAQPWRIARRFGWSLATVKTVADELCRGGLVERLGGAQNPTYRACNSQNPRCKNPRSKTARCKKPRHLHSDQLSRTDQSAHKDQLLRKARKRASFDLQRAGTDGTSGTGTASSSPATPPEGAPSSQDRRQLADHTADVLGAVAAECQTREGARLAETEQAIAQGDREPWTPDLLHRIAGMGVDVAALVERYRKRTGGRPIDDPNAYLFAMAKDAVAKRVRDARAQAEAREALAQLLGRGDVAAGYAALAMIPDSPHRKQRPEAAGTSQVRSDGAMQLGALLPTLGIAGGLAAPASTAGG